MGSVQLSIHPKEYTDICSPSGIMVGKQLQPDGPLYSSVGLTCLSLGGGFDGFSINTVQVYHYAVHCKIV